MAPAPLNRRKRISELPLAVAQACSELENTQPFPLKPSHNRGMLNTAGLEMAAENKTCVRRMISRHIKGTYFVAVKYMLIERLYMKERAFFRYPLTSVCAFNGPSVRSNP